MKVFASFLLATTVIASPFTLAHSRPEDSVRHMSYVHLVDDKPTRSNHCTTFALKTKLGVRWISAAHCVVGLDDDADARIGSHGFTIEAVDENIDLAVMAGEAAPGLTLATRPLQVRDFVFMYGFPFGWPEVMYRDGVYAGSYDAEMKGVPMTITTLSAAPGDSGSPIFNSRGEVVGVMQAIFCGGIYSGFCSVSASGSLVNLQYILSTIR